MFTVSLVGATGPRSTGPSEGLTGCGRSGDTLFSVSLGDAAGVRSCSPVSRRLHRHTRVRRAHGAATVIATAFTLTVGGAGGDRPHDLAAPPLDATGSSSRSGPTFYGIFALIRWPRGMFTGCTRRGGGPWRLFTLRSTCGARFAIHTGATMALLHTASSHGPSPLRQRCRTSLRTTRAPVTARWPSCLASTPRSLLPMRWMRSSAPV